MALTFASPVALTFLASYATLVIGIALPYEPTPIAIASNLTEDRITSFSHIVVVSSEPGVVDVRAEDKLVTYGIRSGSWFALTQADPFGLTYCRFQPPFDTTGRQQLKAGLYR